jgi:hypothetical protein
MSFLLNLYLYIISNFRLKSECLDVDACLKSDVINT